MRNTPTSVITLSIIGLIFAAIALASSCVNIGLLFTDPSAALFKNSAQLQFYYGNPVMRQSMAIQSVIGLVVAGFLAAGCIGSFTLKAWARRMMNGVAWVKIVLAMGVQAFAFVYLYPKMLALAKPGTADYTQAQIAPYLAPVALALAIAYPVCVLYFYRRPKVIDAFNGIFPPKTDFPVQMLPDDAVPPNPPPASPMDEQFP